MSVRTDPLRARLRAIEPDVARAQTAAIAALNGREVAGLRTVARLAGMRERRAAAGWILFDTRGGPVAIAPLLADGALARIAGDGTLPDGAAAAAVLAAIEPLVATIETLLGLELRPAGLRGELDEERLLLRLDGHDAGGPIRHRLLLALPLDIDVDPDPPVEALSRTLATLALRWRGTIAGPRLPLSRLGRIGSGDLILLGQGAVTAEICLPGLTNCVLATIDPIARRATLITDPNNGGASVSNRDGAQEETHQTAADGGPPDPQVPIRIEFDGGSVAASALATMAAGSVLPLPTGGGTLAVRVVAGETFMADGELVAVGEGYGVLIGRLAGERQG